MINVCTKSKVIESKENYCGGCGGDLGVGT